MSAAQRAVWRRQQARAAASVPVVADSYQKILKRERLYALREERAEKRQKKAGNSRKRARAPDDVDLFNI